MKRPPIVCQPVIRVPTCDVTVSLGLPWCDEVTLPAGVPVTVTDGHLGPRGFVCTVAVRVGGRVVRVNVPARLLRPAAARVRG